MAMKKLPLGIENFEEIRTEDFYYIDKSMLIADLLNGWGKVNLFTRPRRFGKTLNMSMLKSFFEIGTNPQLFDGLAISKETKLCEAYMGKFPVLFISLKGVEGLTYQDAERGLANIIIKEAKRFRFLKDSTILSEDEKEDCKDLINGSFEKYGLQQALLTLTNLLCSYYGRKVILLIDEYDVPLDKAFQNGYYREMLDLVRSMFHAALKTNDSLYFAVMTGCLRVSKESIFTGLNNLKVHSISDEQFDEYFGFTHGEVETLLKEYGIESHQAEFKEWYDGYRFGEQDVYCPWDVLNYAYDLINSTKAQPKAYWLNTSGNDKIRRLIEKSNTVAAQMEIENLIDGQTIHKEINDQLTHAEIDQDIQNLWSLLYMTGYLTMVGIPNGNCYELTIPNKEVRQIFIQQVMKWFHENLSLDAALTELYTAFEAGDAAKIEQILNQKLLDAISYHDDHESFYHGFLMALLSSCETWYATSNLESGKGRNDILVERKDRKSGFIVEVKHTADERKLDEKSEEAVQQIIDKKYVAPLKRYKVQNIWLYGIAFCDKECRVLAKRCE